MSSLFFWSAGIALCHPFQGKDASVFLILGKIGLFLHLCFCPMPSTDHCKRITIQRSSFNNHLFSKPESVVLMNSSHIYKTCSIPMVTWSWPTGHSATSSLLWCCSVLQSRDHYLWPSLLASYNQNEWGNLGPHSTTT